MPKTAEKESREKNGSFSLTGDERLVDFSDFSSSCKRGEAMNFASERMEGQATGVLIFGSIRFRGHCSYFGRFSTSTILAWHKQLISAQTAPAQKRLQHGLWPANHMST